MSIRNRTGILVAASISGLIGLIVVSLLLLHQPYYGYIWYLPWSGLASIAPTTAFAALRVWIFWALGSAAIGALLLRADPDLGAADAILAGAAGMAVFAYVGGNLLGPLGLFRSWTLWLALLAALVYLARARPCLQVTAPSSGILLAMLAFALIAVGVLPMQLGSPVPPYMDILNNPASAQRVVTFHIYLPWDNHPYGHWGPEIQTPGLELLYAMLAMGAGIRFAVLAETAATLPMMGLIIFATWRLGRVLLDDAGGGFAAILLIATTIFMRGIQMRGTAVAFVLVAAGLGFFLDRDRRPLRSAAGAIILGTAFSWHAIEAAFGLAVAGIAVAAEFLEDDLRQVFREALCMAGALLMAVPEFAVATATRLPYPILPISQIAGIATIWLAASGLKPRPKVSSETGRWIRRGALAIGFLMFVVFPSGVIRDVRDCFPLLSVLFAAGLLAAMTIDYERSSGVWLAAIAILAAQAADYAIGAAGHAALPPQTRFGMGDIIYKLQEYWTPYFLVFPAAALFTLVSRRFSMAAAIAILLIIAIFPWHERPDLDINYHEHPLVDQWAVNWQTAKAGWWSNSPDHRWLQSPAEFALIDKLREEIRAGRITAATHIVHIAPDSVIWRDELLYSMYLGIDDDIYLIHPGGDLATGPTAGGRMYPTAMLPAALAARPPYIVVYHRAPSWMRLPPTGYTTIFHRDGIWLYRRN